MDFSCSVNVSRDSVTHSAWSTALTEESESTTVGYVYATIALIFFTVGIPMNAFVMTVIIRRHLWNSVPMILMLNLTVSNMAICVLILPFVIVSGYSTEYIFGSSDYTRCRVCSFGIFNICLPLVAENTIALMSVERLLYLKLPLKYGSVVTPRRVGVAVLLIWIVCIFLTVPSLFGYGEVVYLYQVANCVISSYVRGSRVANLFFGVVIVIMEILGISVIVIAYLWIAFIAKGHLFKNANHYASLGDAQISAELSENYKQQQKEYRKKQFRMVQLLGLIFGVNAITWIPFTILVLVSSISDPFAIPILYFFFGYSSYLSAVVIYPLLQVTLTYEIKEEVFLIFKKVFSVCST